MFLSIRDHQRAHVDVKGWWRAHYNAGNTDKLAFGSRPDPGYRAFFGRPTANKGVDIAIGVARRANNPLRIGGDVSDEPGGREFFANLCGLIWATGSSGSARWMTKAKVSCRRQVSAYQLWIYWVPRASQGRRQRTSLLDGEIVLTCDYAGQAATGVTRPPRSKELRL